MFQLTLQERISERIVVQIVVVSVPQFQEQIVEIVIILSGAVSAAHWAQIVDFPALFFGIFLFSVKVEIETNSLRIGEFSIWPRFAEKLGHAGIWKISSRFELECGTTPAGRRRSSSSRERSF